MTRIYEYQVGITEATERVVQGPGLTICPNPFSNLTWITLGIEYRTKGDAKSRGLKIYDIGGRMVKDFSQQLSGIGHGVSTIAWDGKDADGRQLPGGVYFVRLEMPCYKETRKVILLK